MLLVIRTINRCSLYFCRSFHSNIRVRFAPSPTGFLHLGGLRTAFYNYLFAKKNNGKFILRIEDTDQKRVKPDSVQNLMSMLKWTDLLPDESPESGGPFAPYIQSERLEIYKEKASILLQSGAAYRCFCSETRLNLLKKEAQLRNLNRGYDNKCRNLTSSEQKQLLSEGKTFTIRFKIPIGEIVHKDIVYGESTHNLSENEGDFIIMKSDGFPTYHFSCVVDDHLMQISHVLRGTEWLVSTPKHIMMYQAFGWIPPSYAHLPLLINSDRTKLSKRQDASSIEYFKNKGYFPESLLNFLAVAGGGFGRQEGCHVHSIDILSSKFQLENVNTSSCIVDMKKLDVFNHSYIVQQLSKEDTASILIKKLRKILKEKYGYRYEMEEKNLPDSYILKILLLYRDRLNNLHEFVERDMDYVWTVLDLNNILKRIKELKISDNIVNGWKTVASTLAVLPESEFKQENITNKLKDLCSTENIPYVPLMRSLRILLTGQKDGPGVAEILVMLGKQRSLSKFNFVLDGINKEKMFSHM